MQKRMIYNSNYGDKPRNIKLNNNYIFTKLRLETPFFNYC